jgi:hypothetical protein
MSKTWKTEARIWDRKKAEFVTVKLAVDIDWVAVAQQLGASAYANKSGKSIALGGLIKAKVVA